MRVRSLTGVLVLIALLAVSGGAAQARTIAVSVTDDPAGAGACPDAPCSLRQAFAAAQDGDVIQLSGAPGAPVTYALTQGVTIASTRSALTLRGGGPAASVIDGLHDTDSSQYMTPHRPLKVSGGSLAIDGVGFENGTDAADENCCQTYNMNGGGDLYNAATLTLDDVAFSGYVNSGTSLGGGLSNAGDATLRDVSFDGTGAAFGGGLFNRGTLHADGVTFDATGGSAFTGGAFFNNGGIATLTNATIYGSGWASSQGGGITNHAGSVTVLDSTLAGNVRGALETDVGATTSVGNTILASGFADGSDYDCVAANAGNGTAAAITADLGGNIDQDDVCGLHAAGDQRGVDPLLGALADNGGGVQTMALGAGSPARDAALDAPCAASDARGVARPQGPRCDVGAFEVEVPLTVAPPPPASGGDGGGGVPSTPSPVAPPAQVATPQQHAAVAAAIPLPLQCSGAAVALLDVHRSGGSKVIVTGLARPALAGQHVTLTASSKRGKGGTATVQPDGTFTTTLPAPAPGPVRYRATIGGETSAAHGVSSHGLTIVAASTRSVTLHLGGGHAGTTITITRQTSCGSSETYKKVHLPHSGTVTIKLPRSDQLSFYRATATTGHTTTSSPVIAVRATS